MKTWRRAKNTYEIQWQDLENDDQILGMTEKEGGACTRHLVDTPSKEKRCWWISNPLCHTQAPRVFEAYYLKVKWMA